MALIAIIGPSGAGKSTLINMYLAEHPEAKLYKSATTRPRRDQADTSHNFMTDERFDEAKAKGELLPSVEVYGYRYALPKISDTSGVNFVLIRAQFVPGLKAIFPDARVIQIEAPIELLISRLRERGDISRASETALTEEIEHGRLASDAVIVTNQLMSDSYEQFERTVQTN
ncbi:MAG: GTPase [Candidatus Saccharimonas sp.]